MFWEMIMSNKDRPVFDNCRAGDVINFEHDYYNSLFDNSEVFDKDDSDYFDSYYKKNKISQDSDSES